MPSLMNPLSGILFVWGLSSCSTAQYVFCICAPAQAWSVENWEWIAYLARLKFKRTREWELSWRMEGKSKGSPFLCRLRGIKASVCRHTDFTRLGVNSLQIIDLLSLEIVVNVNHGGQIQRESQYREDSNFAGVDRLEFEMEKVRKDCRELPYWQ